ncbi:tetratricopeptide repeat protein [Paracoccus sp. NGMCC 1.201697]|uniref:Tetratricopeptide repeat protein n=1 Tax=Paracoccus broussonetiae subsp. drimophilus TaxID=3373869 RepID=A0ABW7LJM3_9RHOB
MRWLGPLFHIAVAAGLILSPAMSGHALAQQLSPPDAPQPKDDGAPPGTAPDPDLPEMAEPPTGLEPAEPDLPTADARLQERENLDLLFAELAQPDGETWARAETDILRIWSRSGSAAMDLLYKRGEAALDAGDTEAAIGHLTALTDHAPDFAGGWYLRGVAFYLEGQVGPSISDMARTLTLEPRHFGALTQLGAMFEELGDDKRALEAYRATLKIHPHQEDAADAVERLEDKTKGTDA